MKIINVKKVGKLKINTSTFKVLIKEEIHQECENNIENQRIFWKWKTILLTKGLYQNLKKFFENKLILI